jgi:hypothetical protein
MRNHVYDTTKSSRTSTKIAATSSTSKITLGNVIAIIGV